MGSIVRRRLQMLVGLLAGGALVSGLLLAGQGLLPAPVLAAGRLVLFGLIAAAGGAAYVLGQTLEQALASVATALKAAVQETADPTMEESALDSNLVGEGIGRYLAGVCERIGLLTRQRDEQKLAARLAQKRCRHLETVVRCLPDAVVVTDAMDRVVTLNKAAARLFHQEQATETAQGLLDCIPDRGLCEVLRGAHALPAAKEVEHCLVDGPARRVLSVSLAPLADDGQDKAQGAVAVMHDVTRERAAARMKTEFVANASHELRTPLGGIKAYLEMLTDGEVRDEQTRARFYQVMQGELERLGNLVDNILNIARIEAGIVKVSKEQVPLAAIVQEVVETMQPQAKAAGITLHHELLPVYFHVYADREMMRRAVFNLVSNALKYTPQGGRVIVRMKVDEAAGEVTVDVSDNGVGISEEDLPRLFQKFFRVESSKKMAKGTGLGLVLVKEVVEGLHGGRVTVQSVLGKGSTFSVTLGLLGNTSGQSNRQDAKNAKATATATT